MERTTETRNTQYGQRFESHEADETGGNRLTDALGGNLDLGQIGERIRQNPLGVAALALAAGYLLHRGDLLPNLVGGGEQAEQTPERQRLLAWLNDAYAMEKAQIPVLENHAKDARNYPRVRRKDLEHLEQTRRHAELVKGCIRRLGGKPSTTKKLVGQFTGAMNSVASEPFSDEVVKNFLSDFATEHLEIASYKALIVAAREAADPETARICEQILREEEEMARWLDQNLAMAVRETLDEHWEAN